MREHRRSPRGYTLIELLVVISIIIVLAGMLLTAVFSGGEEARGKIAKMEMHKLAAILSGILNEDKRLYNEVDATDPNLRDRDKWHCVYIRRGDETQYSNLYKLLAEKGYLDYGKLVDWDDDLKNAQEELDPAGKSLTEWEVLGEQKECKVLADPWGEPYLFYVDDTEKTITIRSFGADTKDFMAIWPGTTEYPAGTIRSDLTKLYKLPTRSKVMLYDSNNGTDFLQDYDDIEVVVYM